MKAKWLQPFTPFVILAYPPPGDFVVRCMVVLGTLFVVGVYLAMAQPWSAERAQ